MLVLLVKWLHREACRVGHSDAFLKLTTQETCLSGRVGSKCKACMIIFFTLQLYSLLGNPDSSHSKRTDVSICWKDLQGRSKRKDNNNNAKRLTPCPYQHTYS